MTRVFRLALAIATVSGAVSLQAQNSVSTRVTPVLLNSAPYRSVGLVESGFGGQSYYRGSGAVARDARLFFGCAHVIFDGMQWADEFRIVLAWNDMEMPAPEDYTDLRGFRAMAGYAPAASIQINSTAAFENDFAVGFSETPLGTPLNVSKNGTPILTDFNVQKLIVGYPAEIDESGDPGYYFMHQTGPFNRRYFRVPLNDTETQWSQNYLYANEILTGPGNSGGPVLDLSSGPNPILIGILVSGWDSSGSSRARGGVFSMTQDAWNVSTNALAALAALNPPPTPSTPPTPVEPEPPTNYELEGLVAQRTALEARLIQVRRIPNPQARTIQLRRIQQMLTRIRFQIAMLESGA